MPLSIFSTNLAVAINAPVLPAETTAWARPSRTRLIATRIDESFLVRKAFDGDSSIEITSLAGCTLRRSSVSAGSLRVRSEEHTSELQSLMRISYAVFCLKKTITYLSLCKFTLIQ